MKEEVAAKLIKKRGNFGSEKGEKVRGESGGGGCEKKKKESKRLVSGGKQEKRKK